MWIIADLGDVLSRQNVFLLGLILVIAVLMLRVHRRLGRRQQTKVARPGRSVDRPLAERHVLGAPAQMQQWEVEMHDLARDVSARLDSKISALQSLILSADERIERLDSIVSRGDGDDLGDDTASDVDTPAPPGRVPHTQADALSAARATASGGSSVLPSVVVPQRPRQEIYALDDEGLSAATIAARVGSPIGEVELVLSLRRRRS